jgi:hypothetical protein
MLIELIREGMQILAKAPKRTWWSPDDLDEHDRERNWMGLSELDTCPRRLWYSKNEDSITNPTNPDMNAVWWIGSFVENVVIRSLEAAGVPVRNRQATLKWGDVEGHPDGYIFTDDHPHLAEVLGPGRKFLLELKSAKHKKIKDAKKKGIREAFPGYFIQMQAYLIAHELTYGEKLDGAIMLMGNKAVDFVKGESPDAWYEELIPPDPMYAQAQMTFIQDIVADPEIYPRPYTKPDPLCHFCPFAAKCWKGTDFAYEMQPTPNVE